MRLRKSHPDAGSGWGPFTGRQLTTIVVASVVMVMFPVGAFAVVAGSNSFITDHTTGKQAKVTSTGQLSVSAGPVIATPAIAGNLFQSVTTFTADACTAVATAPDTLATVVTKVQASSVNNNSSPDVYFLSTTSDCSDEFLSVHVSYLTVGTSPTGSADFELATGVALAKGDSLYMGVENGTADLSLTATALGYNVPATQCATGCL